MNVNQSAQPLSSVLLSDVDQFRVSVLNPNELEQWPENNVDLADAKAIRILPKGLRITFTIKEVEYEWIFSLLNTASLIEKKDGA